MRWTGRFEGYNMDSLRKDLIAGFVVGSIAIPLGMAFAIGSGVDPRYGIYTTIVAGILISMFGGSRYQIGGPTGAFIPILFAIVMQYGYENLLIAGMMAGIMLVLMGVFKLGALIRYIPQPVTIGFTAGIAVLIFSGQIASFLGLEGVQRHEAFVANMHEIFIHLDTVNVYSIVTALLCLAAILMTPRYMPKLPGSIVGLVLSSLVASLWFDGQVATIGSSFGAIPTALPNVILPDITWDRIVMLLQPALVIALLGGVESLLSAVVADNMTGERHRSNRELIGQGIANMATPLFGGIPATGAIARTAANIKNGAVSPLSGVIHGLVVLLVLLLLAPYASAIPLASMAPVLMVVAWNMSERKHFGKVLATRSGDAVILVAVFLLTVFTSLTTAVEAGFLLAIVLLAWRMSRSLKVENVLPDPADGRGKVRGHIVSPVHDCPQIRIQSVEGVIFFGTAERFEQLVLKAAIHNARILILRMGKVPVIDTTGAERMSRVVANCRSSGAIVLVTGLRQQPCEMLKRTGVEQQIGADHLFEHTGEALAYALARIDATACIGCRHFAFRECTALAISDRCM